VRATAAAARWLRESVRSFEEYAAASKGADRAALAHADLYAARAADAEPRTHPIRSSRDLERFIALGT
jgi:hypothetical protein